MRLTFVIFQLFIGLGLSAQLQINVEAGLGRSYAHSVEIQDRECTNHPAFIAYGQLNTQFSVYQELYTQVGLGLRYANVSGVCDHSTFKLDVYRMEFSSLLAYPITKRFDLASGIILTTHRDFKYIALHRSDNFRWDLVAKPIFRLNEKIRLVAAYKRLLNDIGGEYLVGNPKHSVLIGAQYLIKS